MPQQLIELWTSTVTQLGPAGAAIAVVLIMAVLALLVVLPRAWTALSVMRDQDQLRQPPPPVRVSARLRRRIEARILREINADVDRRHASGKGA